MLGVLRVAGGAGTVRNIQDWAESPRATATDSEIKVLQAGSRGWL